MTASEAIKILKKDSCYECSQGTDSPFNCEYWECRVAKATRVAIQALEKQIPKKPTPIDYEKYIDVIDNARFLRGAYWCPNCKRVVKSGSFCSDCGQKLDWSDEE